MAKDFKLVGTDDIETKLCTIATGTVIEAGDLLAMSSGLIVKAGDASAKIAWAPEANASGEVKIAVTVGNDFLLSGTSTDNFAVIDKGTVCDVSSGEIDINTTSTDVLKVDISTTAGTVDSKENVRVKINKPLF